MFVGKGLFGRVDQVHGRCYVATRFFFVSGLPVIPLDSWAVVEDNEVVSPEFLFEVVSTLPSAKAEAVRMVRIPFSWKSVAVTYLRAVMWPIHGGALALLIILGGAYLVIPRQKPLDPKFLQLILVLILAAVIGGMILWLSYRVTRATNQRASQLFTLLGIRPPPPRKFG